MSETARRSTRTRDALNQTALEALRHRGTSTAGFNDGRFARDAILRTGRMIRTIRTAASLSQKALAEKAHSTQPEVSRIENGRGVAGPSIDTLDRLSRAMGGQLDMELTVTLASGERIGVFLSDPNAVISYG